MYCKTTFIFTYYVFGIYNESLWISLAAIKCTTPQIHKSITQSTIIYFNYCYLKTIHTKTTVRFITNYVLIILSTSQNDCKIGFYIVSFISMYLFKAKFRGIFNDMLYGKNNFLKYTSICNSVMRDKLSVI